MARAAKFPEVIAVRLSTEGLHKLQQLSMQLDRSEADVMRFLIKRAQVVDVQSLRFDRGEREPDDAEMCTV